MRTEANGSIVGQDAVLLKAEQVAQMLNLGRSTVFELMASGQLPVVRFGRAVRVPREDLDRWIRDRVQRAA